MTLILAMSMLHVPECLEALPTSLVLVFHHTLEMDSLVKVYLGSCTILILPLQCNTDCDLIQLYNNGTLEVNVLCSGFFWIM